MKKGIAVKDLYIISLGKWQKVNNSDTTFEFNKESYALARKIDEIRYVDVFTNSTYSILKPDFSGNYELNDGIYCHDPKSINQFFQYKVKNQIIFDTWGYITKEKAQLLLNDLNLNYNENNQNNTIKVANAYYFANKNNIFTNDNNYSNNQLDYNYKNVSKYNSYNILNKRFISSPIVGREKELENLIFTLATKKKNPILVGESGVGKTAIVDMLAYNIKNNNVPNFLINRNIMEISSDEFIADTKYRGSLEKKFNFLIDKVIQNNDILFIDEIHTIFGGVNEEDPINLASLLKQKMDRNNLKLIGTTTSEEYNKYFTNDAIKRRFNKINVLEPDKIDLEKIVYKIFENYSLDYNILIDNLSSKLFDITEILINLTDKKHRNVLDYTNNPDILALIIDLSFASARINNQDELMIENIITGISMCDRIYDSSKIKYIKELKSLNNYDSYNCNNYDINVLKKKK